MSEVEDVWSDEAITCPYCGYVEYEGECVFAQVGENLEGDFVEECGSCGREFDVNATRTVTFTSSAKKVES